MTWPDCLGDPYELAITITEMERDIEELKKCLERLERILEEEVVWCERCEECRRELLRARGDC